MEDNSIDKYSDSVAIDLLKGRLTKNIHVEYNYDGEGGSLIAFHCNDPIEAKHLLWAMKKLVGIKRINADQVFRNFT